jgi:hypothetical protein
VVLNRIIPADPTRIVAINGTVISELQSAAGRVKGGSVAFYSPGGLLIGSNAVFDVGSLLLTTLDPVRDGSGNFLGTGGNISLVGASGTTAPIITEAGSQIRALSEDSYVAMVAPRIQHGGSVRVNGSAAYVAAEQASFVINDGLIDLKVQVGTSVADPIQHLGSTGGPASSGEGDNHKIYMVAVPKNQAITMMLSGSAGFDAATSATGENGEIILSAGL